MAEIEGLNHTGRSVPDVREGEDFYVKILGAKHCNTISSATDDVRAGRGAPHPCNILAGYLFVLFPHNFDIPIPDDLNGVDGSRIGFAVSHERFDEIVEQAQDMAMPFSGPIRHPERGPFGESIYFTDPGGNFMEICWRRDLDAEGLSTQAQRLH
ncbi:MAG TPA: VOC family protein [Chloroflexota bacterium]|jgi:catechol 2,3-dioxygenase-like lactoylglutathione lyase family enzyme